MNTSDFRILLVDDEPDIIEFLSYNLKKEGYHVFTALTGEEGIAVARKETPHLILLDVMMPGMSGLDVLNEIRNGSNKKIREIPVMMITAKSSTEDIDKALALGANSYVVKPFRGTTIREKVRTILELPFNG